MPAAPLSSRALVPMATPPRIRTMGATSARVSALPQPERGDDADAE